MCFETLDSSKESSEVNENEQRKNCQEVRTLKSNENFPVGEVATAAGVASTTTIIIAIFLCCICPKICNKNSSKRPKKEDEEKVVDFKDENDNSTTPPNCSPTKLRATLKSGGSSSHDSSLDVIKSSRYV